MTLKKLRDKIRGEMKVLAVEYIDSIIYFNGYEKSNVHWKMMELACSYVKGTPFNPDEDGELHLLLHKESRKVTDHLDEKIGFSYDTGFRDRNKHDIEVLGENLANAICELALATFPDAKSILVLQESIPKPTLLKTPVRGLMS